MDTMDKHLTIKTRGRQQSCFNIAIKVSKIALCAFYAAWRPDQYSILLTKMIQPFRI